METVIESVSELREPRQSDVAGLDAQRCSGQVQQIRGFSREDHLSPCQRTGHEASHSPHAASHATDEPRHDERLWRCSEDTVDSLQSVRTLRESASVLAAGVQTNPGSARDTEVGIGRLTDRS